MKAFETMREQAIEDCRYGYNLDAGEGVYTALYFHIGLWDGERPEDDEDDREYRATIHEIKAKLNTEECLLK